MARILWAVVAFLAVLGALFLIVFLPVIGLFLALGALVALLALGGLFATASRWRARRAAPPPPT